jgi:phosphoribosylanthranilate isomerase
MTIVQIYGAEHPDDALALAAMGCHHLGFRIEDPRFDGERMLSAVEARSLFDALPPQVVTIALFASPDERLILRTVEAARPRMVQFCWDVDLMGIEWESRLRQHLGEVKVIKAIPVGDHATRDGALDAALRYQVAADYFILDTPSPKAGWVGASGETHDWSVSREIVERVSVPCILAGGLDADNVEKALQAVRPWGVDSYSRTSLPDDRKDMAKVRRFVEAVRRFDAAGQAG